MQFTVLPVLLDVVAVVEPVVACVPPEPPLVVPVPPPDFPPFLSPVLDGWATVVWLPELADESLAADAACSAARSSVVVVSSNNVVVVSSADWSIVVLGCDALLRLRLSWWLPGSRLIASARPVPSTIAITGIHHCPRIGLRFYGAAVASRTRPHEFCPDLAPVLVARS